MPHIKVKPFDPTIVDAKIPHSELLQFRARSLNQRDELWGVTLENEPFLLQVKYAPESVLIKYDKVTRPLKVNLLKEALSQVATQLDLEVIASNIAQHKQSRVASEYEKHIEDFYEITFPKEKVAVEVGFGSGRHLLYQAQKHPDTLFIGLEIHTPSAQQVLKQIALQGLDNIWVVNYDARLFLEMLPSNLLETIFVHFPVPWDKKPHRRVISPTFLAESMRALRLGGRLELRTDSDNYFWYALETFFGVPKTHVEVRKNEALEVTSKYEARWLRMEKDIYDVYVTALEESKPKAALPAFDFPEVTFHPSLIEKLPKKALVFEGYFVHIERLYLIGEQEALLIKCSFGSFDRPEHKYILLDQKGCSYYASPPVRTSVNHKAHIKLTELLSHV